MTAGPGVDDARAPGPGVRAPARGPVPPGCARAWFVDRLLPGTPTRNVARALQVEGSLDPVRMAAAWWLVTGRYEALRTTLGTVAGRPSPRIRDEGDPASWRVLDAVPGRDDPAAAVLAEPVDLETGPTSRLTLVRRAGGGWDLVLTSHRAVLDEDSLDVVLAELCATYAANGAGPKDAGPGGVGADGDAAGSTGADVDEVRRAAQRLVPPPPPAELPRERTESATTGSGSGRVRFDWSAGLGSGIRALAAAEGTTEAVVVAAGLGLLLAGYGRADRLGIRLDLAVGGARRRTGVGVHRNETLLVSEPRQADSFRDLVRRTAAAWADAEQLARLPLDDVLAAASADHDPRAHAIQGVLVAVRGLAPVAAIPGCRVSRRDLPAPALPAQLAVVLDAGPGPAGYLTYRPPGIGPVAARAVLGQLEAVLAAGCARPDAAADELRWQHPAVTAEQVRSLDGRALAAAAPPVPVAVRRTGELDPDRPAVLTGSASLGYGELVRRASAVAAALRGHGCLGVPVAVRVSPGASRVVGVLGVLMAGAHLLWFGAGDVGSRGRSVLADSRPGCLLVDATTRDDDLAGWFRDRSGGPVLDLDEVIAGPVPPAVPAALRREDRAYLAYTSGSTGRPKGIAQTHGVLADFAAWFGEAFGLDAGVRLAQWVAPEHDPAIVDVFATMAAGAVLCPVPDDVRRNPFRFSDWLADQQVDVVQVVPSFARAMLGAITSGRSRRPALRWLVLMGEMLPADLVEGFRRALPGTRLANIYGPTESIAATWCDVTGSRHAVPPIGGPIPGRQVLVLDDRDRVCPPGMIGEVVIRGAAVTTGYEGSAVTEAFRPLPAGWDGVTPAAQPPQGVDPVTGVVPEPGQRVYRTGDLARQNWEGLLEFHGRKDFQVKLMGKRLELGEVEAWLQAHPTVAECGAVATRDRDGLVTGLVVYVVAKDADGRALVPQWRNHLRVRFGHAALPVLFGPVEGPLPRTVSGKVDRAALPDPATVRAGAARPPSTPAELAIAELWCELLSPPRRPTVEDTVLTLGGGIADVVEMVGRLNRGPDPAATLWTYFDRPTLGEMAAAGAAE